MLISIAWRNLWRNKARSTVIILAIAIGIVGGVVSDGLMTGMADQRVEAAISNEVANIQIHNPEYLLNNEIQYLLPDVTALENTISKYPETKGVSAHLRCLAMASSASAGAGVNLIGVVPEKEHIVSDIHNHITEGEYFNSKMRIPAVAGQKLAKKLDLKLNDRIIVTFADTTGTITSGAFEIVGIYKTSNTMFDVANLFVKKSDLAALAGFSPQSAHELVIRLNDNSKTDVVVHKIKRDFQAAVQSGKITVRTWYDIQPLIKSIIEMTNMFSFIFMLVILIALAFAIVNTMVMAIMERTREIGMLMALGMNKKRVFSMIMLETLFLSLAGAILGLAVSLLVVHHYAVYGFDLTALGEGMNAIGYSAIIYFRVNTGFYITTIIMVILLALIAAISPARKALKLQPATAIRNNEF